MDAGLYQYAALGDRVWLDSNANGIQDGGELGIAGVTVNLLDGTGSPTGSSTTTDGSGIYGFGNLVPGKYGVQFIAPASYVFTGKDVGVNDTVDSDADLVTGESGIVTLMSGENNLTLDAGLYQYASLGDRVWLDSNANGVQDFGEPGIEGVTVNLLDGAGNPTGSSTTTDGSGIYGFGNLVPGKYGVQFMLPSGYVFTGKDIGVNDAVDSDADLVTGKTGIVTLTSGQNNDTLDAGLYQYASLGDFVWLDSNSNGMQDAGEPGVANVPVTLLDGSGNPIPGKTTTTNASGFYSFTGLLPGTYAVQFTAPSGYQFTAQNSGMNNTADSDANLASGKTGSVTLASGQTNETLDAGLVAIPVDFTTFTLGGWGATPQGNNPGTYLDAHFAAAFPNGLKVPRKDSAGSDIILSSANEVRNFLRAVQKSPFSNAQVAKYVPSTLEKQFVALTLNVGFDDADPNFGVSSTPLGNLKLHDLSGGLEAANGLTIRQVLQYASDFLDGIKDPLNPFKNMSAGNLTMLLGYLNEAFDGGTPSDWAMAHLGY